MNFRELIKRQRGRFPEKKTLEKGEWHGFGGKLETAIDRKKGHQQAAKKLFLREEERQSC